MRCGTQVLVTFTTMIMPLQLHISTSLSPWQTKEGRLTGKQVEPHCGAASLPYPEKRRMRFCQSPRELPPSVQLEQLFMNRGICGIWQWLTRNLDSMTMLGVALRTR